MNPCSAGLLRAGSSLCLGGHANARQEGVRPGSMSPTGASFTGLLSFVLLQDVIAPGPRQQGEPGLAPSQRLTSVPGG